MLELHVFEQVADALRTLVPDELGPWRQRNHAYGIKVWFSAANKPERVHYEAQVVSARHAPEARHLGVEIGLHCEHSKPALNEAVIAQLEGQARRWRKPLGEEAVAGEFLGREGWRRLSEVWADPDLSDADLPIEIATRLLDYASILQPLLRTAGDTG